MTRSCAARFPALVLAGMLVVSLSACGGGDAKEPAAPVQPVSTDPLSLIIDSIRVAFNMPAMGAAIVTLEDGAPPLPWPARGA